MKAYPITYWYGIRPAYISRERLVEAKECGFNLIECDYGREDNLRVLAWCDELGLAANVRDGRIDAALAGQEGWEAGLDEMIVDYAPFSSVNRYFMRDEPVDDYFPTLGRVADYLHTHDPAHGEYINLLPYHALPPAEGEDFRARYQRHIDGFCDIVHPTILSYDHYNLGMQEVSSREALGDRREAYVTEENRIRNGWEGKIFAAVDGANYYNNLEIIRENAARRGLPWMDIILLVEHWHYRHPLPAEIRWEAFTALAYGSTALSYFTYWTPGTAHTEPWSYHYGIILSDGTRGENYEVIKALNAELQVVYAGLALPLPGENDPPSEMISEDVYHVEGDADELTRPFAGYGKVSAITGGRMVAGFFAGGRFILVNKDYTAPVTASIQADGALYHLNKTTGTWEVCDGAYTLAPGDGELFAVV